MDSILLIAPDFLVIVLGVFIARVLKYPRTFWNWAEKLVFYILFPPLLFTSIAGSKLTLGASGDFLAVGLTVMAAGTALCWMVKRLCGTDDVTFASVFQTGFRFNTYIGFALCLRLFGEEGFAYLALLIAFWVPVSNTCAVAVLAHAVAKAGADRSGAVARGGVNRAIAAATLRAVYTNPLIIATIFGLIFNVAGLHLPEVAHRTLEHLGSASLAVGLLCIGAGLEWGGVMRYLRVIAVVSSVRLVGIAFIATAAGHFLGLTEVAAGVLILFAALPTGQSCYVMTAAMGGNAPAVAAATTAQTVAAMATLPVWISLVLL